MTTTTSTPTSVPLVLAYSPTNAVAVAEVNLKRLVKSCEKLVDSSSGSDEFLSEDSRKSFTNYLSTIKKLYADLKAKSDVKDPKAPSKESLSEYSRKIDFLTDIESKDKMALPINTGPTYNRLVTSTAMTHDQKNSEMQMRLKAKKLMENSMRGQLLETGSADSKGSQIRQRAAFDISSDEDLLLDKVIMDQRKIHESITDELVKLSQNLKENSRNIEKLITDSSVALDELDGHTSNNLSKIEEENKKLKDYTDTISKSTLTLWVVLVLVTLVFMGTYIFMKLFPKVK